MPRPPLLTGRNRLVRGLAPLVIAGNALALATFFCVLLLFENVRTQQDLRHRHAMLAQLAGHNVALALSFNDPIAAAKVLQTLHAEPSVLTACLYGRSGQLLAHYQTPKSPVPARPLWPPLHRRRTAIWTPCPT